MIVLERLMLLRKVSLFSEIGPHELVGIAEVASEEVYTAGSVIVKEGEVAEAMFVILEGTAKVMKGETEMVLLSATEYFGELSILDRLPRSASVLATTDCLVLRISRSDLLDVMQRSFEVTLRVIESLTRIVRRSEALWISGGAANAG